MMRVICQFKIWTIIVLSLFVLSSKGQVYQSMPQYGYSGPRFNMDSTLSIPTVCGTPTLKSNLTKKAAIAFDSCNGVFYQYNPKTLAWSQITGSTGTAVDTIYKNSTKDSIIFTINGRRRAIKDSIGPGGSGSPAGSDGYVQFNNNGSFGGSNNFVWNKAENKLGIRGDANVALTINGNSQTENTAEFGTIGIQSYSTNNAWFGDNVYFDGVSFTRRNSGYTGLFYFQGNEGQFRLGDNGVQGAGVTNGKSQNGVVSLKTNLSGMFAVGDMNAASSDTAGANFVVDSAGNIFIPKLTKSTKINVIGYDTITKKLTYQAAGSGTTIDTTSLSNRINQKLNISDSSNMLSAYLRKIDTASLSNRINQKLNIVDTANKWVNSVTKLNDSTIRVIKGSTTTDITLTPTTTVTAATRLVTTVYNNSGSTIEKGSVIYINGRHSSNYPTIAKAQANTEDNSYSTFALVQDDITNNSTGTVIQAGNISNLNLPTATYTDGQVVYLSPTVAGGITTTKPLAPYHIVKIGTVTRAHPTQGSIELKIENGWQLDELSDVKIALVPLDSTILQFSRVDSLWHDVNPTTAMGSRFLKPSDTANKFVNRLEKNATKDSILFYIGSTRYAIKDSIGSGGSSLTIKNSGSTITTAATSIDFTGSGVTSSATGGAVTVNISGGTSGGGGGSDTIVTVKVYNAEATTISKGNVVYIDSSNSGRISVKKASNDIDAIATRVIGLAATNIAAGDTGYIITQGTLTGVYTLGNDAGKSIYLSTNGNFTSTMPSYPKSVISLGVISNQNASGSIYINPQLLFNLKQLSGVQITNDYNNKILYYDSLYNIWAQTSIAFGSNLSNDSTILSYGTKRMAAVNKASPGGTYGGAIQYKKLDEFVLAGANTFAYDPVNKSVVIADITQEVESEHPLARLDVHEGDIGGLIRNYEIAQFSRQGDCKLGVFTTNTYSSGAGSSILLGNALNTNSSGYYPGFEMQNVNDSSYGGYVRFNYVHRNQATGIVAEASADLLRINSSGKVEINPINYSLAASPRLVVGEDNSGTETLEIDGTGYINDRLKTNGAREKRITFLQDTYDGSTYSIQDYDHIVIYVTNDYNSTINLPTSPAEGRELIIKQGGDSETYTLTLDAGTNEIYDVGATTANLLQIADNNTVTLVYFDGSWFLTTGNL